MKKKIMNSIIEASILMVVVSMVCLTLFISCADKEAATETIEVEDTDEVAIATQKAIEKAIEDYGNGAVHYYYDDPRLLFFAFDNENFEFFEALLEAGADTSYVNGWNRSLLFLAFHRDVKYWKMYYNNENSNDLKWAKALLENGVELYPDPDDKDNNIFSYVIENSRTNYGGEDEESYYKNYQAINLLIEYGLDPNVYTTDDVPIVDLTLEYSPDVFLKLISLGGKVTDPKNAIYNSSLRYGWSRLLGLKKIGYKITDSYIDDRYDLLYKVLRGERISTYHDWFLLNGYDIIEIQKDREPYLLKLFNEYYDKSKAIKWVLEAGDEENRVDPDMITKFGYPRLWCEVNLRDEFTNQDRDYYYNILLDFGADPNYVPDDGQDHIKMVYTATFQRYDNSDYIVAALLSAGTEENPVDPNYIPDDDEERVSMLHHAVYEHNNYLTRVLLEAGADPNYVPEFATSKKTMLHEAVLARDAYLVEKLLEYGAEITKMGSIDLFELTESSNTEIYDLLIEHMNKEE
jgi:ankyrin repeat protein